MAGGSWTFPILRFPLNDLKTKQISISIYLLYLTGITGYSESQFLNVPCLGSTRGGLLHPLIPNGCYRPCRLWQQRVERKLCKTRPRELPGIPDCLLWSGFGGYIKAEQVLCKSLWRRHWLPQPPSTSCPGAGSSLPSPGAFLAAQPRALHAGRSRAQLEMWLCLSADGGEGN